MARLNISNQAPNESVPGMAEEIIDVIAASKRAALRRFPGEEGNAGSSEPASPKLPKLPARAVALELPEADI